MRNDTSEWLFRAFKLLAIAALVVMLTQPETWMFAVYFLDASMLDVLAVLLQARIAMILVPVLQRVCKPAWMLFRGWLAGLGGSRRLRIVSAAARTFLAEWSGPLGATSWLWMHARSREFCRAY